MRVKRSSCMPCHAHRDRLLGRVTRAAVRLSDVRQHHLSSHSRPPAVTDVSRPLQSPRGSQCPPSRAFVMVNGSVGWSAGVTHKSTPGRSPSCQACRTRTAAACSKCTAGPCTSAPGSVTTPSTSGFARKAGKERSAYPFRRLQSVHAVHSLGERSQRSCRRALWARLHIVERVADAIKRLEERVVEDLLRVRPDLRLIRQGPIPYGTPV